MPVSAMANASEFGTTGNALNQLTQSQFGGPTQIQINQIDNVDSEVRIPQPERRNDTDNASRRPSSGETSAVQRANPKIVDAGVRFTSPTTENIIINSTGGAQFEPNILTTYDNPTYNFRLFLSRENAEHDSIATEDIIVIAETGSTGFNIQDVNIATTISPGGQTKNTIAELIKFKILEPHGNRLLDQIRNAALSLGIFDHRTAPMWLQLTFKGYTADNQDSFGGGIPSESNQNDDLNDIQLLWKIKVTDVEIEIDKGGTVYEFSATPSAHIGLKDESRRLEKEEKIEARTLGEYFTILADRLNAYENYDIVSNIDITKRVRRYAFAFPDGKSIGANTNQIDEDGQNISAIMLQNGMARSLHVPPNDWQFRCYDRLDKQAQHLKTGLWSSAQYQTLDVATLIPRTAYHSQFLQVSGIVSRIGDSKKNIWINMGSQFAIRINKSSLSAFKEINFKTLVGKKITARGYVVYYPNKKQFRMLVRHPIALTIN